MNYYIQGDAANADKIKAAFERNGIDTSANSNYGISNLFYFSCNGEVAVTQNGSIISIIKTHPDYKELELPIEPKFKKWDWIACDADSFTLSIKSVKDGNYFFHQGTSLPIKDIDEHYHLWTIQDARIGDILTTSDKSIFIYAGLTGVLAQSYFALLADGYLNTTKCNWEEKTSVAPATKEQRNLLFKKMHEAGYEWDDEKKKLKKIPKHYDISNFHAGMPVLVRADNNCRWNYSVFSRITGNKDWPFAVCNGVSFTQCIPFEGNEHLLGTTDMCDEQYINW